jgi:parallel beta-helix repeat protein
MNAYQGVTHIVEITENHTKHTDPSPLHLRTTKGHVSGNIKTKITMTLLATFPLIFILLMNSVYGSTYYVATSGNNNNSGTLAAPWRTLSHSVSKLQPGDTLFALGGTYAETVWIGNSGTASNPIIITAYGNQKPVIDGATLSVGNWASLISLGGNYIFFSGFEIRNINADGHGGNGGSVEIQGGDGVNVTGTSDTVSNLTVHNTWAQGIIASGDYDTIQNSTVYYVAMSNCRLSGQTNCSPSARSWSSCVTIGSPFNSGKITKYGTIAGNTVFNCWGEGISTWLSNGTTIQDNIVYDNWAENLYVDNAVNALVQRNIIYNTSNNYVQAHSGFALADEVANTNSDLNQLSSKNTVINNLILNAQFSAYGWTIVPGSGLNNVLIANNTIVSTAAYPGNVIFATGGNNTVGNVVNQNSTIFNNIVSGTVSAPSASGLTFSNNAWTTSPPAATRGVGDIIGNPQLAEAGSTAAGQLTAGYFQLLATSPAFGKGRVLSQVAIDFNNAIRPTPPAMGALDSAPMAMPIHTPATCSRKLSNMHCR